MTRQGMGEYNRKTLRTIAQLTQQFRYKSNAVLLSSSQSRGVGPVSRPLKGPAQDNKTRTCIVCFPKRNGHTHTHTHRQTFLGNTIGLHFQEKISFAPRPPGARGPGPVNRPLKGARPQGGLINAASCPVLAVFALS